MSRRRLIWFLLCNLAIVVMEIIALNIVYGQLEASAFIYYTQLSNIFLLFAAIFSSVLAGLVLIGKLKELPSYAWKIYHSAVSATTVTFLVVVFVLSFMVGDLWYVLTNGSMLFTHTICPLLALFVLIFFAPKVFHGRDALAASWFTFAYAIVSIIMNITHTWYGPYPFLLVYEQPLWATFTWIIGIVGGACMMSRILLIKRLRISFFFYGCIGHFLTFLVGNFRRDNRR